MSSTSTVTMQTIATLEAKLEENVTAINTKLNLLVSKLFNEADEEPAPVAKTSSSSTGKTKKAGEEVNSSGEELQN